MALATTGLVALSCEETSNPCEDSGIAAYAGSAVTIGTSDRGETWGGAAVSVIASQPYELDAGKDTICGGASFTPLALTIDSTCSLTAVLSYPDVSAVRGRSMRFTPAGASVGAGATCALAVGDGGTAAVTVTDGTVVWTEGHLGVHLDGVVNDWSAPAPRPQAIVWDFQGDVVP